LDCGSVEPRRRSSQIGILGYVSDTVHKGIYTAMVIKKNPGFPPGRRDQWEVLLVDVSAGTGGSAVISGKGFDLLGAETVSVSGIGIAAPI
jgi:hypothetical protein